MTWRPPIRRRPASASTTNRLRSEKPTNQLSISILLDRRRETPLQAFRLNDLRPLRDEGLTGRDACEHQHTVRRDRLDAHGLPVERGRGARDADIGTIAFQHDRGARNTEAGPWRQSEFAQCEHL